MPKGTEACQGSLTLDCCLRACDLNWSGALTTLPIASKWFMVCKTSALRRANVCSTELEHPIRHLGLLGSMVSDPLSCEELPHGSPSLPQSVAPVEKVSWRTAPLPRKRRRTTVKYEGARNCCSVACWPSDTLCKFYLAHHAFLPAQIADRQEAAKLQLEEQASTPEIKNPPLPKTDLHLLSRRLEGINSPLPPFFMTSGTFSSLSIVAVDKLKHQSILFEPASQSQSFPFRDHGSIIRKRCACGRSLRQGP